MFTQGKKFTKTVVKLMLLVLLFTGFFMWNKETAEAKYDYTININFRCQGYPAKLPYNYLTNSIFYSQSGITSAFSIFGTGDSRRLDAEDIISIMWPSADSLIEKVYVDDLEYTPQAQGEYEGIEGSVLALDKMGSPEDKIANITLELKADSRVKVIKPYTVNIVAQEDGQDITLPEGLLQSSYFSKSQETPFTIPANLILQENNRLVFAWSEEQTQAAGYDIVSVTVDNDVIQPYGSTTGVKKIQFSVADKDRDKDNNLNIVLNVLTKKEEKAITLGRLEYQEIIEVEQDSPIARNIERFLHREVKIIDQAGIHSAFAPIAHWEWKDEFHPETEGDYKVVGDLTLPEGWEQADPPIKVDLIVRVIPKAPPLEPKFTVDKIGGYSEFINAVAGSADAENMYQTLASQLVYVLDLDKQEKITVKVKWESADGQLIYSNVPGHYKMRGRITLPLDWRWKDQEEFIYTTLVLEKDPQKDLPEDIQLKDNEVKFWLSDQIQNKSLTWHFEDGLHVFDSNNQPVQGAYLKGQAYVMDRSWRVQYIVIDPNFAEDNSEIKNFDDLYVVEVNGEERNDLMSVENDPSNKNPDGSYKKRCIFTFNLSDLLAPQDNGMSLFALSPDSAELNVVLKNRVNPLPPEEPDQEPEPILPEPSDKVQEGDDKGSEIPYIYIPASVVSPVPSGGTISTPLPTELATRGQAVVSADIQNQVRALPATGSHQSLALGLSLLSVGYFLLVQKKRHF